MIKQVLCAIIISLSLCHAAQAYGPCDEDEAKLCDSNTHAETVKACLHKNVERLTAECKAFVKSKEADWQKTINSWSLVKKSCASEVQKQCSEEAKMEQMKALQVCLMAEAESLSAACKKDLNRHIREFQPSIKPLP